MRRTDRPGWTRGRPNVKGSDWIHESGWQAVHCGHQTAIWPFYLVAPGGSPPIVSWNGLGFQRLEYAQRAVELIVAGLARWTLADARGVPRVLDLDAAAERPPAITPADGPMPEQA